VQGKEDQTFIQNFRALPSASVVVWHTHTGKHLCFSISVQLEKIARAVQKRVQGKEEQTFIQRFCALPSASVVAWDTYWWTPGNITRGRGGKHLGFS